ncbi:uncharacterized protein LOC134255988 [Saccostrea cucullata]|uniref:uncharacterized protein LOC134255988 n=1 Tax=Saccostrea cuccullata TaxID=36930 RepID=UPI002ED0BFB5
MTVLREVDPLGVENRRRHRINRRLYSSLGPNHVWHVDGYDKLKPYGISIHGCIDGFSRRLMWLTAGSTNSDPAVVVQYFIGCIRAVNGFPLILQADPGTENSDMGAIQCTLRHEAGDCFARQHSFRVVKSTFNQRIEAWWSMLRRLKSEWWIRFFHDLELFGLFHRGNVTNL